MELIALEEALKLLMANVKAQSKSCEVGLANALNRYIAQDIYAPTAVPAFNRAAMDGYAVKAGETKNAPLRLKVIAEIVAGDADPNVKPGENCAIRVTTGALIPDGFDAVIRQEATDYGEDFVEIYQAIPPYSNYAKTGEDLQAGELVISQHTKLTPIHLGMLASLGIFEVTVWQPLKVGLIATGSELANWHAPLLPGQIYNSNQFVLKARLVELGVDVCFESQLPDQTVTICQAVKQQINNVDLLITTGGVSVGKTDIMHEVINELGASRLFWRVDMTPGTPMLASTYQEKLILSLSGNPFASLTTFELLAKPVCLALMHQQRFTPAKRSAILLNDFAKTTTRRRFVRAYYEAGTVFLPTLKHQSSVLSSMIACNCLIDIATNSPALSAGTTVNVILLD